MKKYKITYPIVAGVLALASAFFFGFITKAGLVPTMWMTVGCMAIGLVIARIVLHLVEKDNSILTWQRNVYAILGTAGWVLAAFSQKTGFASLFTMIACSFGTIFGGTYFTDLNKDGVPDILQDIEKIYSEDALMANLQYKFKNDVPGVKVDKSQPLCLCNGQALTVAQALEMGFTAEAETAMEYIRKILSK